VHIKGFSPFSKTLFKPGAYHIIRDQGTTGRRWQKNPLKVQEDPLSHVIIPLQGEPFFHLHVGLFFLLSFAMGLLLERLDPCDLQPFA
jgi:hypothetical protein